MLDALKQRNSENEAEIKDLKVNFFILAQKVIFITLRNCIQICQ